MTSMDATKFNLPRVHNALIDTDINWQVESRQDVESTNTVLVQRAKEGAPEGTVLVARHQTHGRGRQGRRWVDRPGHDLLASIILHPDIDPAYVGLLSLLPAAAVVYALRDLTAADFMAKWPNDIMIEGNKVGGILAEADLKEQWAVLGMGINLLGEPETLPEELLQPATTVQAATGLALRREDVLAGILEEFGRFYEPRGRLKARTLLEQYRQVDMTLNREVTVNAPGEEITGTVRGIDDRGRLMVADGDRLRTLDAGDVHIATTAK